MNKKKLLIVIALAVLVAVLVGVYFATRPQVTEGQKTFTLVITHKDGTTKEQTFSTDAEFLGAFLEDKGIITGAEGPYGMYIKAVEGEKAVYEEDNAYWAFYEGENYANLGVDQTPIADGAVYKLVYTPAEAMA